MSNSLWPHGLYPTKLLCPWGFSRQEYWSGLPCRPPGDLTNSGIEPRSPALQADSLPSEPPWKPKNTGVNILSLLQGIFPTLESNQGPTPGLPPCGHILYQLSHKGSPRIQERVTYPFSIRSSGPRNQTRASCIAGGFFTNWATREVQNQPSNSVFIHETQYHLESSENIFIDQKVLLL